MQGQHSAHEECKRDERDCRELGQRQKLPAVHTPSRAAGTVGPAAPVEESGCQLASTGNSSDHT
jgi:hypothetical protein